MKDKAVDTGLISKLFFRLLPVQILLSVVTAVNGTVSSLFAGNFCGPAAMSAIGLFSPIVMLMTSVGTMLMGGSQLVSGKYMGRNQVERTQGIFAANMLISSAFSLLSVFVLLLMSLADLTRIFTADSVVRIAFNRYILGHVIGIPPMILGQQLSGFLSLENQSRRTTVASVVFIAVNTLLGFLFVAVLRWEAFGLALASSIGLWVFFGIQAEYYFAGRSVLKLSFFGFRFADAFEIVKTGYPGALSNGYQTLRGFIVNALILQFVGNAGLSAFAASDSVMRIFWAVPTGMLAVSRMLISISVGEEDRGTLTGIMRVVMYRCIPLMCGVSALIILCAEPLTRLFYRDPALPVYQMTVMAFRVIPLCMPFSTICTHFVCYGQASGKQLLVHILSILDGVVCVAAFTAILIPFLGMNSVYIANILNGIVCVLTIVLYSAAVRKKFPRNMGELMVIPDAFGVSESERIDITVRTPSEVVSVSGRVIDFCRERGIDERRSYHAGLFLEEMAGNVVDHGFIKDKKSHSVDIRVIHKGEDVILRLRDDCIRFDPAERQAIADPEDSAKNIGIRLVYAKAKAISYQNMLGLNVLTIRI